MDKLGQTYNELKLILISPQLYLIKHFSGIRKQIYLECAKSISNLGKNADLSAREKIIQLQLEMINEVDLFAKQCLDNLRAIRFDQLNLEEFEYRLKKLDLKDRRAVWKLEKELDCELLKRKEELLMGKSILFFEREQKKLREQNRKIELASNKKIQLFGSRRFVLPKIIEVFDER